MLGRGRVVVVLVEGGLVWKKEQGGRGGFIIFFQDWISYLLWGVHG